MKQPSFFTLAGVMLTSLSVLTLEIVFTRVFSVLMSYHFAFMAISLALLGSGIAGVWLYLSADRFPKEKSADRLTLLTVLFAWAVLLAFLVYLRIPLNVKAAAREGFDLAAVGWLSAIYLVLTVPFLLGGAVITLAVTHYSAVAGRVYGYDLVGAGLGCLVSIAALTLVSAPGAVILVSVLAALAGLAFAWGASIRWRWTAGVTLVALIVVFAGNSANNWVQVRTRDGYDRYNTLRYEAWNALARVTVYEDPYWLQPFGWGLSPTYVGPDPGHLMLLIDADAGTPIQRWDGTQAMIDFLRYDLTSVAYNILPEARSFIIGAGGGRDILTALLYDAAAVTAVEINPAVVDATRTTFGEYAGYVYDQPNVDVAVVDARTYLAASRDQYDLIQASLIDTWASAASGAYSLSENGLYTREAFLTFFDRLTPRGMVSYSRWYFIADPTETLRLVALGLDSWQQAGVADPADHVLVIANLAQNRAPDSGLATMLLKKTPFTPADIATLAALSEEMAFTILYAPGYPADPNPIADLINAPDLAAAVAAYPLDISPPTDNRPFFFNFVPFHAMGRADLDGNPAYSASVQGNIALLVVLGISAACALIFVLLPLWLKRRERSAVTGSWPFLGYYAALGVGFMLVLVPSIQRLTIYLGSPTYALTIVLFTILVGSGLGSRSTAAVADGHIRRRLGWAINGIVAVVALHLLLLPPVTAWTQSWPLALRAGVVIAALLPAGFCMGQPFPLGLTWISRRRPAIVPWLWAVNGVTSVIGSALATVLGLTIGFVGVSVLGMACYGSAAALAAWAWERDRSSRRWPLPRLALRR